MSKAKIQREDLVHDTVFGNLFDLEGVRRITTLVYGRPLTGKTLLIMYEGARLAKIYGGKVLIFSAETNYTLSSTQQAIKSIFDGVGVEFEIREERSSDRIVMQLYKMIKEAEEEKREMGKEWAPEYRVVIVDSLRSLSKAQESQMSYFMRRSQLSKSSSIIPALESVVYHLSWFAHVVEGWAFAISSATPTISGLFKGIVPFKPSFSEKALHDAGAIVWLGSAEHFPENVKNKVLKMEKQLKDVKIAVLVTHRTLVGGKGVVFEFQKVNENGVDYVKPNPLFTVEFKVEEEEAV